MIWRNTNIHIEFRWCRSLREAATNHPSGIESRNRACNSCPLAGWVNERNAEVVRMKTKNAFFCFSTGRRRTLSGGFYRNNRTSQTISQNLLQCKNPEVDRPSTERTHSARNRATATRGDTATRGTLPKRSLASSKKKKDPCIGNLLTAPNGLAYYDGRVESFTVTVTTLPSFLICDI